MENYTRKEVVENGNVYYLNSTDQWHRTDGPAIEYVSGAKFWYINGLCHRFDGPAVVYSNGDKEWWINDKYYHKHQHNAIILFSILEPIKFKINKTK
jgi:hypothetical protein